MATRIKSENIADSEVKRQDLNTTTTGSAVIAKLVAGKFISISSTGADVGTGDVTPSLSFTSAPSGGEYIYADSNTTFNISPLRSANSNVDIHPATDITNSLGASNKRFLSIYAQNIYGTITPSNFTAGSVVFAGTNGVLSQDNSNLFWDNTNKRLGIGLTNPSVALDVVGQISSTTTIYVPGLSTSTSGYGIRIGNSYTTQLTMHANTGAHFYMFHNTLIERDGSNLEVMKWATSHATFGSRGIRLTYGNGNANGIEFYADAAAATAGSTFTPTQRMIISNLGNVGIGSSSPITKLQVANDCSDGTDWTKLQFFITGSTTSNKRLALGYDTTNNKGYIQAGISGTAYSDLILNASGGNVGIGVTSPAEKLQIEGNLAFDTTTGNKSIKRKISSTWYDVIKITTGDITITGSQGIILNSTGYGGIGKFDSNAGSYLNGNQYTDPVVFYIKQGSGTKTSDIFQIRNSSDTKLFIMNSSGNVGIGTSTASSRLHLYNTSGDVELRLTADGTYDSKIRFTGESNTTGEGTLIWYDNSNGDSYFDNVWNGGTDANPAIRFRTKTNGTAVDALSISHAGDTLLNGKYFYIVGNESTDGSWRLSATLLGEFLIEARDSGTWSERDKIAF